MVQDFSGKGFVPGVAIKLHGAGESNTVLDTNDGCVLDLVLGGCEDVGVYDARLRAAGCLIRYGAGVLIRADVPRCMPDKTSVRVIVTSGRMLGFRRPTPIGEVLEWGREQEHHGCPGEVGFALALYLAEHNLTFNNPVQIAMRPIVVDEKCMMVGIEGGDVQLLASERPLDHPYSPDTFWAFLDRPM